MTNLSAGIDLTLEHTAMARAWEQVNPEELVDALRAMPAKVRNRLLSRLKTPSAKVTVISARLLATNLARASYQDRFRAADTITSPVIDTLGEQVDKASNREEARAEVVEVAGTWGASIVVLAAVCGLITDADRFAPVLLACADAGHLSGELADIAAVISEAAETRLAANAASADVAADEPDEGEPLERLWEQAVEAVGRVSADLTGRGLPDVDDIGAIERYAARLVAEAERYGVEPTVSAVGIAEVRAELDAALADLASRLRRLTGPTDVADALVEVHEAAGRLAGDSVLAKRLGRFLDVVTGDDGLARLKLAGELRAEPSPPAGSLLDAAMIGLLHLAPEGAAPRQPEPINDAEPESVGRASQPSLLDADTASSAGTLFVGHPHAGTGPVPETAPVARPTESAPDDILTEAPAAPADGAVPEEQVEEPAEEPAEDAALDAASVPVDEPSGPGGNAATVEAPISAEVSGETGVSAVNHVFEPQIRVASASETAAAPASAAPEPVAGPPSPEECNETLARMIAGRRFSLAHHLAAALGHDLRAEVLAEAVLAHTVRRSASPAAAAMVERAMTVPVPADDRGSVALRAASAIRVALLDPSSGAAEVLRPLLDPLAAMPLLRSLAVAVIESSTQNLAVPAGGFSGNRDRAREQSAAISSWAEDTLARPRHNLVFRGIEIWKQLTGPGEPAGQILAMVADNDTDRVPEVRQACLKLNTSKDLERAVQAAEAATLGSRPRGSQTLIGGARQALLRALHEVVTQAWAWCDANSFNSLSGGLDRVEHQAMELRERLEGELDGSSGDSLTAATLTAAAASLAETINLFADGSLAGDELEPAQALNRGLVVVNTLSFNADGVPDRKPDAGELVRAATEGRKEAFEYRLSVRDFPTAEAILALRATQDQGFDAAAANKELLAAERQAASVLRERWEALDREFAAARARGRIDLADAATFGALLEQANPEPEGDAPRRDLGRVEAELDDLSATLAAAADRRRETVRADIDDAIASGELETSWRDRLRELVERDELGAAEEYLHRARAGGTSPEEASALHEPDGLLGAILADFPGGVTAGIAHMVRKGESRGVLDFSRIDEADRSSIADALDAWIALGHQERPASLEQALFPVLRLLGLIPRAVQRTPELRSASTVNYWYVDIDGESSGYAYVPEYGSRSSQRRRFMLCWADDLPVSQLWTLARTNARSDEPVYVLYFGTLSTKARIDLARHARSTNGQGVVVIDAPVMLRCALEARQSFDVTMRAVLPYAAPNPYNPNLLAGMPIEMFYGRRAERDKVKSLNGTSIISGGRRFGKTALLRSAQQELASETDIVVDVIVIQDVAAPPKEDPAELWPRLAARLIEKHVLDEGNPPTAEGVCGGIRAWLAANPLKKLLVMLDECDFFLRSDANNGFTNVVHLRNEMGDSEGRFKVVFSGLQHVARYRSLPNQPLSHFPEPLVIGPLDATSASDLVRRPLHAIGWSITPAQVDRIVTYCACNPSVIQLACANLLGRLYKEDVSELAPWDIPDPVVDELLRSPEVRLGVRDRLFRTLDLDDRYKLLAYLLAWRANTHGLGEPITPAELRRMALDWWPDGFGSQRADDVRALCDELVGLGVFAGDAENGYRMLSPGMVRIIGDIEEITEELIQAENYDKDRAVGAAGSRMKLGAAGEHRYSPLTAAQLADVIGAGRTQLRVVVGSRATRVDAVPRALTAAAARYPKSYATVSEVGTLRNWRESMRAPSNGHLVVVSDMTVRGSETSWEQSIESARRRGATRTERGTRSAVLVAGPDHRWLLRRLVDRPDGIHGDLADVAVALGRIDAQSLQAWDHIEELDLPSASRQRKLLEVTGGWPFLVERVLSQRVVMGGFDHSLEAVEAHLSTAEGAEELVAAVGLDPGDPDQPADPGLVAVFDRLVATDWTESLSDLAGLLELDDALEGEDDPTEAVTILAMLGALSGDDERLFRVEPVLARSWKLRSNLATV